MRERMSSTTWATWAPRSGRARFFHIHPHRAIELANAVHRASEMQFGAERGLEESVGDLGVGERLALGRAPAADLVMLGGGRNDRRDGERECGDGGDFHGRYSAGTSGHHHGGLAAAPRNARPDGGAELSGEL